MKCTDVGLEEESYACTMLLTSIVLQVSLGGGNRILSGQVIRFIWIKGEVCFLILVKFKQSIIYY